MLPPQLVCKAMRTVSSAVWFCMTSKEPSCEVVIVNVGGGGVTYGLRYARDTGRTGSNLPAIPELNALVLGLGNRVRQPNLNLAPQAGFAWDPAGKGKTSIRGGIGTYYENALWVSISPSPREATGAFNQVVLA